jgi:hypothetical protein
MTHQAGSYIVKSQQTGYVIPRCPDFLDSATSSEREKIRQGSSLTLILFFSMLDDLRRKFRVTFSN